MQPMRSSVLIALNLQKNENPSDYIFIYFKKKFGQYSIARGLDM
jgi:hypothetical protein